jgi:hypothetical protein
MAYLLQTEKGISFELISKKWSPAEIKSFKKFTQEKDRLGKQEKRRRNQRRTFVGS